MLPVRPAALARDLARRQVLEEQMSAPGFHDDRGRAAQAADEHQKLVWETGDMMGQWEAQQAEVDEKAERLAALTPPAAAVGVSTRGRAAPRS